MTNVLGPSYTWIVGKGSPVYGIPPFLEPCVSAMVGIIDVFNTSLILLLFVSQQLHIQIM